MIRHRGPEAILRVSKSRCVVGRRCARKRHGGFAITLLVVIITTLLFASSSALSLAYTINPGANAEFTGQSGNEIDFDGMYAIGNTQGGLQVPTCSQTENSPCPDGVPTTTPGSRVIVGANIRPINIVGTLPIQSLEFGEFFGMGYYTGCINVQGFPTCTGINSQNGGVYKQEYVDGCSAGTSMAQCNNTDGPAYFLIGWNFTSAGDNITYQMQRNYSGCCGAYYWRFWINGEQPTSPVYPFMQQGRSFAGGESLTSGAGTGPDHQVLNLPGDWYYIFTHEFGQPSTSPPGLTSYSVPTGDVPTNDDGCSVSAANSSGDYYVITGGAC